MEFKKGSKVRIRFKRHDRSFNTKIEPKIDDIVREFVSLSSWGVFFLTLNGTKAFLPM